MASWRRCGSLRKKRRSGLRSVSERLGESGSGAPSQQTRPHADTCSGANDPAAKAAAAILLKLSEEQVKALPSGRNWLLQQGSVSVDDDDEFSGEEPSDLPEPSTKPATRDSLTECLAKGRPAAAALGRLRSDRRLLRVLKGDLSSARSLESSPPPPVFDRIR